MPPSNPDVTSANNTATLTATNRPIRVLFDNGVVQTMPLETYLRAVVPAEMPALWPFEAVKAQAVVARSYAQYAIEHPRHKNADICTNPAHCQHYDFDKIHPKSDEAIARTSGIVARYNGETINGVFSANCGGHTRNNEDVFRGAPVPYMRGVACPHKGQKRGHAVGLCQYGARDLARTGHTYEEIIKHYFSGVTLGPPSGAPTSNIFISLASEAGYGVQEVPVRLSGAGQTVVTTSEPDGTVRFSNVPGATYTLELPAYEVSRQLSTTPGQDVTLTLELPPPPPTVSVELERLPGQPLLIGDWGQADTRILIHTPSGLLYQTYTGTKPEFGPGGFEIYANEIGTYTLEFDTYNVEVAMAGQTVRLNFRWQFAGVIEGILRSHRNRPVGGRWIHLIGDSLRRSVQTEANGYFVFESLPRGDYVVMVHDSHLRQQARITGRTHLAFALKFAEPPQTRAWQIKLERGVGLPLLVGDIGLADRPIRFNLPGGRRVEAVSGSKPEFGRGGFEIYALEVGNYIVQFEDQRFVIPMDGQFTHVIFIHSDGAVDEKVQLISAALPRSQAEALLQAIIEATPEARDLFNIEALNTNAKREA